MTSIEILGSGCANCKRLEANAVDAITMAGASAQVVKVTDYREIATRGILSTPGLVIDGVLRSYGRVPSAGEIARWLTEG